MPLAGTGFVESVQDGPLLVAAGVAVLVGVIGFLSPCVLPLVPGYLSYVAGLSGDAERPSQRRMVAGALLFVLGFTVIFVAQGALFGQLGASIREHRLTIERIFGVLAAIAIRRGAEALVSADGAFAGIEGLRRLDPASPEEMAGLFRGRG